MELDRIDVLEKNCTKIKGVATIIDVMSASPQSTSALITTGDTFELLGDILQDVHSDLDALLMDLLQENKKKQQ